MFCLSRLTELYWQVTRLKAASRSRLDEYSTKHYAEPIFTVRQMENRMLSDEFGFMNSSAYLQI